METYRIIGKTNGYIANRDIRFKGKTTIIIAKGLTLKEAQQKLLQFFNEDYGTYFSNWGLVRCNHPLRTSSYNDGTRSYEYDSRYYSIEKCEDIDTLCIGEDIDTLCIGEDIDNCESILEKEYGSCKFCDEKIDDGLDNGDYLMMRSYDVADLHVRLYYPRETMEVTCVNVS